LKGNWLNWDKRNANKFNPWACCLREERAELGRKMLRGNWGVVYFGQERGRVRKNEFKRARIVKETASYETNGEPVTNNKEKTNIHAGAAAAANLLKRSCEGGGAIISSLGVAEEKSGKSQREIGWTEI